MTPIELACRHVEGFADNCAAQAGEPCRKAGAVLNYFHSERVEDAMLMTSSSAPSKTITDEQLDAAIESTGIL